MRQVYLITVHLVSFLVCCSVSDLHTAHWDCKQYLCYQRHGARVLNWTHIHLDSPWLTLEMRGERMWNRTQTHRRHDIILKIILIFRRGLFSPSWPVPPAVISFRGCVMAYPYLSKLEDPPRSYISSRNHLYWDKVSILIYLQDLNPQLQTTCYLTPSANTSSSTHLGNNKVLVFHKLLES